MSTNIVVIGDSESSSESADSSQVSLVEIHPFLTSPDVFSPNQRFFLEDLPSEMLVDEILPYLDLPDIASFSLVSQYYFGLASNDSLWRPYADKFLVHPPPTDVRSVFLRRKEAYLEAIRLNEKEEDEHWQVGACAVVVFGLIFIISFLLLIFLTLLLRTPYVESVLEIGSSGVTATGIAIVVTFLSILSLAFLGFGIVYCWYECEMRRIFFVRESSVGEIVGAASMEETQARAAKETGSFYVIMVVGCGVTIGLCLCPLVLVAGIVGILSQTQGVSTSLSVVSLVIGVVVMVAIVVFCLLRSIKVTGYERSKTACLTTFFMFYVVGCLCTCCLLPPALLFSLFADQWIQPDYPVLLISLYIFTAFGFFVALIGMATSYCLFRDEPREERCSSLILCGLYGSGCCHFVCVLVSVILITLQLCGIVGGSIVYGCIPTFVACGAFMIVLFVIFPAGLLIDEWRQKRRNNLILDVVDVDPNDDDGNGNGNGPADSSDSSLGLGGFFPDEDRDDSSDFYSDSDGSGKDEMVPVICDN